jgi:tetratricopeptide (TPR) repeat protein
MSSPSSPWPAPSSSAGTSSRIGGGRPASADPAPRRRDSADRPGLPLALAALALALALGCAWRLETVTSRAETVEPIFFPRSEIVRPALLGFHGLAADLLWLRTIQYFGGRVERVERFPQLYQLVDMVTDLDPNFVDAYLYGGLFLVVARQFPQAVAIYRKGIAAVPDRWELPHDLGRLYFLELKDYPHALHYWERADRLPGRPHYIPRFLARLRARLGEIETALELWRQILEHSESEAIRSLARAEILKLERDQQSRRLGRPADAPLQTAGPR